MARDRQRDALQTIFSFFVGLMVLAFIAVGVNTFYETPKNDKANSQIQKLNNEQMRLGGQKGGPLTASEQAEYDRIQKQVDEINKKTQADTELWARNTSIVLVLFATMVMGVSLIRSEQLRVLSNGLLLGGLFTMLYGTGWVIFSGSSTARFLVILFALIVTIGLGYLKFVRGRKPEVVAAAGEAPSDAVIGSLEARVATLEARQAAAASALMSGAGTSED
jgi:type VI protein secretion system component VasK